MRDLGVEARILINRNNAEGFRSLYDRFPWISDGGLEAFDTWKDLAALAAETTVVVATTNTSVHTIAEAIANTRGAAFRTGYYVQDYEPLFYSAGSMDHAIAVSSYAVLRGCTYFAKTSWLTGMVRAAHGHDAQQVLPSIDHGLYRPARRPPAARRVVAAMVRPSTPRRAPRRTLRMLDRLARGEFGPVDVLAFGTTAEEMEGFGLELPDGVTLLGRLRQAEVAEMLRATDLFLDLSDYQAFGRTAAEAIACGCIALAPALGGASDFITDGVNGFMADTTDEAAVASATRRALSLSEGELRAMRLAGMEAVSGFTPVRAAISELRVLGLA